MSQLITMMLGTPTKFTHDFFCIRIEQTFMGIETMSLRGRIRAVCPQAIHQPLGHTRQKTMKHPVMRAMQRVAPQFTRTAAIKNA